MLLSPTQRPVFSTSPPGDSEAGEGLRSTAVRPHDIWYDWGITICSSDAGMVLMWGQGDVQITVIWYCSLMISQHYIMLLNSANAFIIVVFTFDNILLTCSVWSSMNLSMNSIHLEKFIEHLLCARKFASPHVQWSRRYYPETLRVCFWMCGGQRRGRV